MSAKSETYRELAEQLRGLVAGESDFVANAANCAALIYHGLDDLNWAGFYLLKDNELVLGPFQGKPACIRIPMGRGVCGAAAQRRASLIVSNVHEFADHIACDSASNSELVVPLIRGGELLGVLDLDSPSIGRFDSEDQAGCERLMQVFLETR